MYGDRTCAVTRVWSPHGDRTCAVTRARSLDPGHRNGDLAWGVARPWPPDSKHSLQHGIESTCGDQMRAVAYVRSLRDGHSATTQI